MGTDKEKWPGGYLRNGKRGPTYVIAREVGGVRFHVSTRAHSLRAAMKQLERFEANPEAYRPSGEVEAQEAPLQLTADLIEAYVRWQLDVKKGSRKHSKEMGKLLTCWMEDIGAADLRTVRLRDHILPALERRRTNRKHRIIAIKGLYGWLRTFRHVLTSSEDCTLDLKVPQASPEKLRRRKALEREQVLGALAALEGAYHDCLLLLMATGWHVTELCRFVRADASEIAPGKENGPLAVLVAQHKSGDWTRTPIRHPEHLAAAQRLRARRTIPRYLNRAVREACDRAKVKRFTLGVLRHSVATWAVEQGAPPAEVSQFLGHKDPRTTARFYTDVAVPTVSIPIVRMPN